MSSSVVNSVKHARNVIGSWLSVPLRNKKAGSTGRTTSKLLESYSSMPVIRTRCDRTASLVMLFAVARASALENRIPSVVSSSIRNSATAYDSTLLGSDVTARNQATCYCGSEKPASSGRRYMSQKAQDIGQGIETLGQNAAQGQPLGVLRGGSSSSHDFMDRLSSEHDGPDGRVEVRLPP
jgi:hypothetical protein